MKWFRSRRAWLGASWVFSCWSVVVSASAQDRVSLAQVLAHADANAPDLVVARARVEEGLAARRGAERLLSDPLSLEVGAGPRIAEGTGEDFDLLVSLTQPIEVAGERGARLDVSDRLRDRRESEVEAIRWQVHREVHLQFHVAIEARVRGEAAERRRVLAARLAEIARRRFEAGDIPELDVALATAELASAEQEIVRARGILREAVLSLAEASGWPARSAPMPLGGLDEPGEIGDDATLVARAQEGHPVLRALEAAVAEQNARVRLADIEASPTLDLGLSFAREGSAGSPANYIGLLFAGVAIPLWDANGTERAATRAALSIAEVERDALRGMIEARVLRAAAILRAARERVIIFVRDVLPGFERSIELLTQGFDLGELDALEVAGASRRLLEVQANALDAFGDYHRALAELEAQVGTEVVADAAHDAGDEMVGGVR